MVYLQVIDVFLGIKIDALGLLLNGHDRETHINATMQLPFLNLLDETALNVMNATDETQCKQCIK